MEIYLKPLLKGTLTFVPGLAPVLDRHGAGGPSSASYCYGVWLKHLTLLWASGFRGVPGTVAELGPGDTLGIGLAAVLSGTNRYYALDVVAHSGPDSTLPVFDDLVEMFRDRAPRPEKSWPDYDAHLDGSLFPRHILTDDHLDRCLAPSRIAEIREAIINSPSSGKKGDIAVRYVTPWSDSSAIMVESVDLAISHSVLEHVNDLDATYTALRSWLKPGAYMSHQIDYTGHGISKHWNGYRACPEWMWRLLRGRRHYLINREPHSEHMRRMRALGFDVRCELMNSQSHDGIVRSALVPRWAGLSDEDLTCSSAFVIAVR